MDEKNTIQHKYGEFSEEQLNEYKKKLHDKIFWCLLYKDVNVEETLTEKELQEYFFSILIELNGLNSLFRYPVEMIELYTTLECARKFAKCKSFNYYGYRKLILDAESLVDKICSEVIE